MLAEPWIYSPTKNRNILYRGMMKYIARGATVFFALGTLTLHTKGTLPPVTQEPTRELAEPRDPLVEDTESRLQNMEGHHRPHVTAEPRLTPIVEPRLDLVAGHISPDLQSTASTSAEPRTPFTSNYTPRCTVPRRLPRHAIYMRGPGTSHPRNLSGPRRGENSWHFSEVERVAYEKSLGAHLANTSRATPLAVGAKIAEADEAAEKSGAATRNGINPAFMQM
jgi:hypothetical protein